MKNEIRSRFAAWPCCGQGARRLHCIFRAWHVAQLHDCSRKTIPVATHFQYINYRGGELLDTCVEMAEGGDGRPTEQFDSSRYDLLSQGAEAVRVARGCPGAARLHYATIYSLMHHVISYYPLVLHCRGFGRAHSWASR